MAEIVVHRNESSVIKYRSKLVDRGLDLLSELETSKEIRIDEDVEEIQINTDTETEEVRDTKRDIDNANEPSVYQVRGLAFDAYSNKEYQEAIDLSSIVLDHDPNDIDMLMVRGLSYLVEYDLTSYIKATRDFNLIIEIDSEYERAYFFKGLAAYLNSNFSSAQKSFEKAVYLNPSEEANFFWLGLVYFELGKYSQAVENLSLFDENPLIRRDFFQAKGLSLLQMDRYDDAKKTFLDAINFFPLDLSIDSDSVLSDGEVINHQESIKYLIQVIQDDFEFTDVYIEMMEEYFRMQCCYRAIDFCDTIIDMEFEVPEAHYVRGIINQVNGKYACAIEDFSNVVEISPEYGDAYFQKGVTIYLLDIFERGSGFRREDDLEQRYDALDDFWIAAEIYLENKNQSGYESSMLEIKQLNLEISQVCGLQQS